MARFTTLLRCIPLVLCFCISPAYAADIYDVIRSGTTEEVSALLDEHPEWIEDKNLKGAPLILHAANYGKTEMVRLLIRRGVDVNSKWKREKLTPLHYAAKKVSTCYDEDRKVEIAKLLLDAGADPRAVSYEKNRYGATPLHFAAGYNNIKVLELLLDREVEIDIPNPHDQKTPLQWAVDNIRPEAVNILIQRGANINAKDSAWGETPLMVALHKKAFPIANALIKAGADETVVTKSGYRMIHFAALSGNKEFFDRYPLTDEMAREVLKGNWSLLHCATEGGNDEIVRLLVDKGADINLISSRNMTPLLYASRFCPETTIRFLFDKGATQEGCDQWGYSPLHWACYRGMPDLVKYFVEHDLSTNLRTKYGMTPLHIAILHNRIEIVQYLIEQGASVHAADKTVETALHKAVHKRDSRLVRILLKAGSFTRVKNLAEETPLDLAERYKAGNILQLLKTWEHLHPEAKQHRLPDKETGSGTKMESILKHQADGHILILVPMGEIDPSLLKRLQTDLQDTFMIPVHIENEPLEMPDAATAKKLRNEKGQLNVLEAFLEMRKVIGYHGRYDIGVIGVTEDDLYEPGFKYHTAAFGNGLSILSCHRLRDDGEEALNKKLWIRAISMTGQMFKMQRCLDKHCPRGKNRDESDLDKIKFCEQCRAAFEKRFGTGLDETEDKAAPTPEENKPKPVETK